ncbi:secretin N-terminal domain-containing protein [Thiomicrorhabdus sp.]|uniref:type II secretion system protein GspD n=1 Tax=Thiomicrorhabdus sp. TaxID=2039724 RepID=UPI0029C8205F|nr:secretin N-terminal domain-containing protein [Thiomicrorhabdus sp.]
MKKSMKAALLTLFLATLPGALYAEDSKNADQEETSAKTLFAAEEEQTPKQKRADYIGDIEFKELTTQDAVRILSELSGQNVIVTKDASKVRFSLFIRKASLEEAVDSMCRVTGLWYRKGQDSNVFVVMTRDQFKEDVLVYRNESTKVFTLKHQNVVSAANSIRALFGTRVILQEPETDESYEFDGDMDSGNSSSSSSVSSNRNSRNNRSRNNNYQNLGSNAQANELAGDAETLESLTTAKLEQIGARTRLTESDVSGMIQAAPIRVTYNSLHNLLLVRSSDERALQDIEQLIKEIDQPAKQVLLQMKIMRVALGEDEDSVFDFQYTDSKTTSGPSSSSTQNPLSSGSSIPEQVFGLGMKPDQLTTGSLLFQVANSNWLAKLAFLETENRTKLISTPLIMASNNKEAEIFIGEERPLVENVSSSGGTVSDGVVQPIVVTTEISKKDIGTKLKIWPRINSDATVTLDIEQEISQIKEGAATIPVSTGGSTLENYSIDTYTTTQLTLTAVAKHAQTIAIGGLIEESKSDDVRGIPGVNKIPVLKDALSSKEKAFSRSELVILIKPYIYDSVDLTGEGLKRVQQELSLDEQKDLLDDEARKSARERGKYGDLNLQNMEAVAQTVQELLNDPGQFDSGTGLDWFHDSLLVNTLGTVEKNGLFFTRVVVTNQQRSRLMLDENSLGDYWSGLAWVFPHGEKEVRIDGYATRSAILISGQPVEQVLAAQKVPVRYVMNAAGNGPAAGIGVKK